MLSFIIVSVALSAGFVGFCVGLFFKIAREVPEWQEMGWKRGFYVRVETEECGIM